jgi:hypothetical protein
MAYQTIDATTNQPIVPMNVMNTPVVRLDSNATIYTDTTTNLTANQLYTGTTRDAGASYNAYSKFRVMVSATAGFGFGHLIIEQSTDGTTFRESHRLPINSEGQYYNFEFPWVLRYIRVKFQNGAVAQTAFFLATELLRGDGGTDQDKTLFFTHSTTALAASATFTGVTLGLGSNHSFNSHRVLVQDTGGGGTLYFDESRDGVTWIMTQQNTIAAGVAQEIDSSITLPYQRIRYVCGATAQTGFLLTSALIHY